MMDETVGSTAVLVRIKTKLRLLPAYTHYIHCPDAATPPFAPTRRRRAPKSAVEGGLELRTARDA
jgi:hypothetical protein